MNNSLSRPAFATTNPATLAAGKTYAGHSAERPRARRDGRPRRSTIGDASASSSGRRR
jgi:hypothetical protein